MEKTWLKHYPAGVPAEINIAQYKSLVELIEESFKKYRDASAYKFMGKSISFGQVDDLSRAFAAYLQSLGLEKGDRVAVMMPNVPQYPVAVAGVLRAGLVVVNVNPLYTPRELEHQLKDSGAKAIVIVENFASGTAAGDCRGADEEGHHHGARRHARLSEEPDRQLRRAQREEDGAGVRVARRGALHGCDLAGPRQALHARRRSAPTTSRCCSTPAARRASARARCCCTATWSPICCSPKPGTSRR